MTREIGVEHLKEPEGAFILRLGAFPSGPLSAIDRIPDNIPGIYAFYKTFNYPISQAGFVNALYKDLEAPRFPSRSGSVKPYYKVTISSLVGYSDGKADRINEALKRESFRKNLQKTLNQALLLQAPLYVGKSNDLRRRITQHLEPDSELSVRLTAHEITQNRLALLLIPTTEYESDSPPTVKDEELFEEIFSRLFSPMLNLRLG
jgi:hypothetical protein